MPSKMDRFYLCCDRNIYFSTRFQVDLFAGLVSEAVINTNLLMLVVRPFDGDLRFIRLARRGFYNLFYCPTTISGSRRRGIPGLHFAPKNFSSPLSRTNLERNAIGYATKNS